MYERDTIKFASDEGKWSSGPPHKDFPTRFAVLTWFDDDGSVPPWYLAKAVLATISELIGADDIIAEYWSRESKGFFTKEIVKSKIKEMPWVELTKMPNDRLNEDGDFPDRFRFHDGVEIILYVESERWDLVGGPAPYHDSCTLSFYSKNDLSRQLRRLFTEACENLNVCIDEE